MSLTPQQQAAADAFTAAHRARQAQRLAGWTAQRLAQEAKAQGCTVRISFDASLPNQTRIDFIPEVAPAFLTNVTDLHAGRTHR